MWDVILVHSPVASFTEEVNQGLVEHPMKTNGHLDGSGHETVAVLLPFFYYQLIAKPGNKTTAVPWPDPDNLESTSLIKEGTAVCRGNLSFIYRLIAWGQGWHQLSGMYGGKQWFSISLTLYMLNFSEGTKAYIYNLSHSSILTWHRELKSFLK